MTFITRFAPSPTGPLHLGHAYSALLAYDISEKNKGIFHLRIEDLDQSRACLLYTSPSPRDKRQSRMPSSA